MRERVGWRKLLCVVYLKNKDTDFPLIFQAGTPSLKISLVNIDLEEINFSSLTLCSIKFHLYMEFQVELVGWLVGWLVL